MNLTEQLKTAKDNLKETQNALTELETLHAEQIKNQKALIFVAKSNVKAFEKLIEKANALTGVKKLPDSMIE